MRFSNAIETALNAALNKKIIECPVCTVAGEERAAAFFDPAFGYVKGFRQGDADFLDSCYDFCPLNRGVLARVIEGKRIPRSIRRKEPGGSTTCILLRDVIVCDYPGRDHVIERVRELILNLREIGE